MSAAVQFRHGSVIAAVLVALAMQSRVSAELVFLPPVKVTRAQLLVHESDEPVRFTPTLWQPTNSASGSDSGSGSVVTADGKAATTEPDSGSADPGVTTESVEVDEPDALDPDAENNTDDAESDVRSKVGAGESVLLDAPDPQAKHPIDVFRFHESSWAWTLRGSDADGIGMFTLGDDDSRDLEFGAPGQTDVTFKESFNFLSGPSQPGSDMPERLYDFGWNVHSWVPGFISGTDIEIGMDINFDLGIHSDFEDSAREGWRFPGHLLFVTGDKGNGWWLAGGFEYLDLDHIQMLPAGGLVIHSDDVHLDLYFPRPRLRLRVSEGEHHDDWLYALGEYRGRAWAIERSATGLADVATLSEYRFAVGLESEPTHRKNGDEDDASEPRISFFEVSWLFGRDLEYASGRGNLQLHDTVMFRVGSRW